MQNKDTIEVWRLKENKVPRNDADEYIELHFFTDSVIVFSEGAYLMKPYLLSDTVLMIGQEKYEISGMIGKEVIVRQGDHVDVFEISNGRDIAQRSYLYGYSEYYKNRKSIDLDEVLE